LVFLVVVLSVSSDWLRRLGVCVSHEIGWEDLF